MAEIIDRPNWAAQSLFLPLHYMHMVSCPTPVTDLLTPARGKNLECLIFRAKIIFGGGAVIFVGIELTSKPILNHIQSVVDFMHILTYLNFVV